MFLDQDQQAGLLFNSNKPEEEEVQEQEQDEQEEEVDEHLQHQLHLPLSLYYFPSPFEDDDVLLFQHHQHFNHETPVHGFPPPLVMKEAADQITALPNHDQRTAPTTASTPPNIKMVDWDVNKRMIGADQPQMIPRRRGCKRDRHSKINTARGLRDRRMRLSLEVARKFFGLQDILGFDKASKTVEWLLIQSDIEIKKLLKDHDQLISYKHLAMSCDKSTSPGSSESCEVVSGIEEAATNIAAINSTNYRGNDIDNNGFGKGRGGSHGNKASTRRQLSREKAFQPRTKASREKARARAREMTEKKKNKHDQLSRMSTTTISWSPFETTGEESAGTQSQNNNNNNNNNINNINNMNVTCAGHDPNSMEAMARCEVDQEEPRSRSQVGGGGGGGGNDQELVTNQDAFGIMGKWCPSSSFNSMQHQSTSTTSTGILQEHHQLADLQYFSKTWEVYNSSTHNLF